MERLALENPRLLEFLEFIGPLKLDGRGTTGSDIRLVKPGLVTMEFAR